MARSTRRDLPGRESEGGRVALLTILGLALIAGALYGGAYLMAGDRIPVGTRIAGVDIGGRPPASAEDVLRNGLSGRADTPFTVTIAGRAQQVRPQQVGLAVDYAASVRAAGAVRSWRLSRLWAYYTAGDEVSPVVSLDQHRFAALVERLDLSDGRPPADGMVTFGRDWFHVRSPRTGLSLDPQTTASAFWSAFLTGDHRVQLALTATQPAVGQQAVDRFVRRFANPAMSSAVTLRLGHRTVRLEPSAYSRLLGARPVGDHLVATVDAERLARLVEARLGGPDPVDSPHDATVALVDGAPHVVPARPGLAFSPSAMREALLAAIRSHSRTSRVRAHAADASFGTADARALGITRRLTSFSLTLPAGSSTDRLSAAAARLDGTVLHPGDSLSLRDRLGPAVPDARVADALATTIFNAAWLAGLRVGSHATHATYPSHEAVSGPLGRDATLAEGQDLVVVDDTKYGVLVSVVARQPTAQHAGSLTVALWSTPAWTVTSSHGTRSDVVPAGRVVRHGRSCTVRSGTPGFDVTVTRTFSRPSTGEPDHSGTYTAHYDPRPAVACR